MLLSINRKKYTNELIFIFILIILTVLILFACEKLEYERVIKIEIGDVSDTTSNSATITGEILDLSKNEIIQHGHCWSNKENPTILLETKTELGTRKSRGSFNSSLTGLLPNTVYYVRSYAMISKDTIYSKKQVSFTTRKMINLPEVSTAAITEITSTSAKCGGTVISDGGAMVTARGVCWSKSENPTLLSDYTINGSGTGTFISNLAELSPDNTYYVRAYATNSQGTAYGNQVSFTANSNPPVAAFIASKTTIGLGQSVQFTDQSTNSPNSWLWNFGDGNTSVLSNPLHTYSTTGPYNVTLTVSNNSGVPDSETKLNYITVIYNYQLEYISGNNQTYPGGSMPSPMVFKIKEVIDNRYVTNLESEGLSLIATASKGFLDAEFNNLNNYCGDGDIGCFGGSYYVESNTGPDYQLDITVSLKKIDQVVDAFVIVANITSLSPQTGTVTDYEGNTYNTVKIGNQWWMAENLKTITLNDGTAIPLETDGVQWSWKTTPAYCWYENNEAAYKDTYGALYNWHTVNTHKLCPQGWHVPSDTVWTELADFLGGWEVAGGKLKETGTTHWTDPNNGATNESGFTALPGGRRDYVAGVFFNIREMGWWWTASEYSPAYAHYRWVSNNFTKIEWGAFDKVSGLSVRCIKD